MKDNIVLIGMPGSGKTTVGKALAALTGWRFLDLDEAIEAAAGQTIPEIFAQKGEASFRELETECAKKAARGKGLIIATGGGIILREENMKALSETGAVVFLDRPVEDICGENLSGRPLIQNDKARVQALYDARINLYRRYGQWLIDCRKSPEAAAEEIAFLMERMK